MLTSKPVPKKEAPKALASKMSGLGVSFEVKGGEGASVTSAKWGEASPARLSTALPPLFLLLPASTTTPRAANRARASAPSPAGFEFPTTENFDEWEQNEENWKAWEAWVDSPKFEEWANSDGPAW